MKATLPLRAGQDRSDHRLGHQAPLLALLTLALGACASYPSGPSVMVLPGSGQSFAVFRADDADCQAYALQSTGATTQAAATQSAVNSALVGTAIGAAAGALIGSAGGATGEGAAIGAASGLLVGSAAGVDTQATTGPRTQLRFDNAYVQCMYAHGHRVPVQASSAGDQILRESQDPALGGGPSYYPPPGTPPPAGY